VVGPGAAAAAAVEDPLIPYKLATLALSTLEIKHGTLQLASALSFLHRDAGIVHRALSPETVVITAEGRWKIAGGFGHAVSVSSSGGGRGGGGGGDGNGGSTSSGMFSYATPASSVSSTAGPLTQSLPLTPPMAYVAPELVLGADGSGAAGGTNGAVTWAADIFSLGALHYELIAHRRWLEVPDHLQTLGEYRAALASAGVPSAVASSGIGSPQRSPGGALEAAGAVVKYMTAVSPAARPAASALGTAAYFHADPGLHALQSLDTFLELDVLGRAALLQSLHGSWALFDGRVLRYRVLPPLLTELRTPQLQTLVLPLILELAERQDPEDFTGFTLPHLTPLLERATGATLLSILRSTAAFAARITCPEVFEARVLPAVLRGVEAPEVLVQEEALRQVAVAAAAGRVRPKAMCLDVFPLLLAAALNTTAAAVRVNALVALGKVAPGLGPQEWDAALAMLRQLLAVDTSAATLMCVLGVADAVGRAGGAALTAARVLPLVCPLTMAPGLNQQQLGTVMRILHAMLDRVEAARMPALKSLQPDVEGGGGGGGGGVGGSGASTETSKGYVGQHGSGDGGGEIGAGSSGSSRYGWAIGGVAGEAAVSFPAFARPPTPPGSDPFVSSSSMFARMTTFAATPAPLAPPPATPLSTSTLGGGWGGGRGGGAISVADQLAAALSSPDDLEALFTEPGYVPVPPASIPGGGNGGAQAVGNVAGFSLL
jgi:SCY1-like protein 2